MSEAARHAVYWLPDGDHPLWSAGCAWLGRDPTLACDGTPPPGRVEPWRYGLHATLKAPIRLRAGTTPADFIAAVRALAVTMSPFDLPPLQVDELDGFVALRPTTPSEPMQRLADRCVTELDAFRAPMSAQEHARRCAGLDARQRALLERWGYPHVLGGWRLHLTLTDRLIDSARRARERSWAELHLASALQQPSRVHDIAVLVEAEPGAPFRLVERLPLGGNAAC